MTSMTVPDAQAYLGANRPQMVGVRAYPETTEQLTYDELVQLLCEKLYESTGSTRDVVGDKFIVTIEIPDVVEALMADDDFLVIFRALQGAGDRRHWAKWTRLISALNQGLPHTAAKRLTPPFNTARTATWSMRSNVASGVTLTKTLKTFSPETGIS